jgi:Lon protease-like protein
MSTQERWLPLFPLNTVLFPGGALPIQVFEDRYKLMMQHCLEGDKSLGIVLIKSGSEVGEPATPHSTGTMCELVQTSDMEDGRMLVSVAGKQRFHIKQITQTRPYMAADVDLLDDFPDEWVPPTEMDAIRGAVGRHVNLAIGLRGGWQANVETASNPVSLSYFIAGMLQADLKEKQVLLEEPSPAKRLELELDLLRRESDSMKRRVASEFRSRFSRH